jgi:acyl-CoA oxidase
MATKCHQASYRSKLCVQTDYSPYGMNLTIARILPQRGGSRPLNHALTYFNRVTLPAESLLGSPAKPKDARAAFFASTYRIAIGTIAIGSLGVPALRVSSYIAARYSTRRTIVDNEGRRKPIIAFRTQKTPIVTALAQSFVMDSLHNHLVPLFCNMSLDHRVRHTIASILKVTMITHAQAAHLSLSDRCGAQGLFEVNQLSGMFVSSMGHPVENMLTGCRTG